MARNLLFLTQTYPRTPDETSGPFIRDLARALVRGGDGVTVLVPHAENVATEWDDDGVTVRSFRYAPEPFELVGYSRSLDADERLKWAAVGATLPYMLGAFWAARRELQRRRYDLLQAHWVVPNGLVASLFASRVPLAVGLHGSDVFLAEKPVVRRLVRSALRRVKVMTGCSPELVDRVCALGFDRAKARVIPYGVDSELFSPDTAKRGLWRERLSIPQEAPLFMSVGRMATKKGFQVLIEALPALMAEHPRLHLVLAGAGDRLEEFRERTEAWRDRIHFPGAVLRDTLPDLYRAADGFVLPAVHDPAGNVDGLPNVILEAMASGLPVLATAISGIPLAIDEGVQGHLVPEQNPTALTEAFGRVLADPERGRAMGRAGRERVLAEMTWDAVAARYRAAYETAWGEGT